MEALQTTTIESTSNTGREVMSAMKVVKSPNMTITLRQAVCNSFHVQEAMLFDKIRWRELVNARKCYAYILCKKERISLKRIARHMGFKTHVNLISAVRQCENHYECEPLFRSIMDEVLDLYNHSLIIMPISKIIKEDPGSYKI